LGDPDQAIDVILAVGEYAHTGAGNPGLFHLVQKLAGGSDRITVTDNNDMPLPGIHGHEGIVGLLQMGSQIGHIAHLHLVDGLQDGTERGLTSADIGPDTNIGVFVPDKDPNSETDPTEVDTDNDLIPDGVEDINKNGRVDTWEPDPTQATIDVEPDLDDDGDVDGYDLAAFAVSFDPLTDQEKLAAVAAMLGYTGFPVDSDGDGILDDGDFSGAAGDYPCVDGETQLCDDNCPVEINVNQADADGNGIGDICESLVDDCNDTHITGYSGDPEWENVGDAEDGDWNTASEVNLANKYLYMNHSYDGNGVRYWQFKYSSSGSQHTAFDCYDYSSDVWTHVFIETSGISGNTVTEPIPEGCLSAGQPIQLRVLSATSAEYYEGNITCSE